MATKQEVSDYINNTYSSVLTAEEIAKIDAILNPETAEILIKISILLGLLITIMLVTGEYYS